MRKAIFACVLAILFLSLPSYAAMTCSIKPAAECIGNDVRVLRISDLADGGSHAGREGDSSFTSAVCCSGVPGLTVSQGPAGEFMGCITDNNDAHVSRTGTEDEFMTCLYLEAPTEIDCSYQSADCEDLNYDTCLFTISEDSTDFSHVSGCGAAEFPFQRRYCCGLGEATCRITDIYWGIVTGESGAEELEKMTDSGPVGGGQDVYLIVETSGCKAGTQVEFKIHKSDDSVFKTFANMDLGTFEGVSLDASLEDVAIALWDEAGSAGAGPPYVSDDYTFTAKVHKDDEVPPAVTEDESPIVTVDGDGCTAEDPAIYFLDECGPEMPQECIDDPSCDGAACADMDCDTVADCLDTFLATVADPSTVDRCSGVAAGTAGCVPAMNCLNLPWNECKNCEAGQPCESDGGFTAGTMFMERCEGLDAESCACKWEGGSAPTGCTDAILNQWDNRFKECIEDEEFPFFDGFNVIAVLLVLSIYYAIIIARKKR